jgi:putative NADH-flavin reductase
MHLFVLGATGGIGQHLLQVGLTRSHEVTAFVRSPSKVTQRSTHLKVIEGDAFDTSQLISCLAGHDCVLSALGPSTIRKTTMRRDFGRALSQSLRDSGVPRAEIVSSALLFPNIGMFGSLLRYTLLRQMVPDMAGMESEIMESGIDWTIIRPPRLTNGSATGAYRVADSRLPEGGTIVSRADVAEFMISEAEKPAHIRHIVGIAN